MVQSSRLQQGVVSTKTWQQSGLFTEYRHSALWELKGTVMAVTVDITTVFSRRFSYYMKALHGTLSGVGSPFQGLKRSATSRS